MGMLCSKDDTEKWMKKSNQQTDDHLDPVFQQGIGTSNDPYQNAPSPKPVGGELQPQQQQRGSN